MLPRVHRWRCSTSPTTCRDGVVVPPDRVVRYDGDDPYLVVAADRGTATFSDIANEIAVERGFWLGDAFASGGSTGYDHKEMGITARGAWVSVHAPLPRSSASTSTRPTSRSSASATCRATCSATACCSPSTSARRRVRPPARLPRSRPRSRDVVRRAATTVRARPRSSWDDYDRAADLAGRRRVPAYGQGDRDHTRGASSASASPTTSSTLTPNELIVRILHRAGRPALERRHRHVREGRRRDATADVGDKANDAIRVERRRPAVPCASARAATSASPNAAGSSSRSPAGCINTDAIDNSAGVDLSDHEVNLKMLLDRVVAAGELTVEDRNGLLRDDERRGRRARPARQLPPDARAGERARAGRRRWRTCTRGSSARSSSPATSTARSKRSRPTRSSADRRAGRARTHRARAGGAARLRQDRVEGRRPRDRASPTIPTSRPCCVEYFPPHVRERYAGRDRRAPAAARDRRHRARQRHGQPRRVDVRVPARRGDRRDGRRDRARPRSGAGGVRPVRAVARDRGARRHGRGRARRPRCTSSPGR